MSAELALLASDLYGYVSSTERVSRLRREPELLHAAAASATTLADRCADVASRAGGEVKTLVTEAGFHLRAFAAELVEPTVRALRARWYALGRAYEAIVAFIRRLRVQLPEGVTLFHLKPRNYHRNLFHVANGVVGVVVYELLLPKGGVLALASGILAFFIGLDLVRRIRPEWNYAVVNTVFGKIARPGELHRIPSATWYLLGLLAGVILFPQHAVELGVLVLAFGDPAASLGGKRWGRVKLIGEKSLAGSLSFVAVAATVGFVFLAWVAPELGFWTRLFAVLGASAAGALAELFSGKYVDDNLTTPLAAGLVAALILGV